MLQLCNVVNLCLETVVSGHTQQSKCTRSSNYWGKKIARFPHFNWRLSGTVSHWTFVPHLHYQRSKACSRHICSLVPTSL